MKYIIMCGGTYEKWKTPKHLCKINGETLVERTIRLLKENGVTDIAISSNNDIFNNYNVELIKHNNPYYLPLEGRATSPWLDGFINLNEPACYIFGDVVFSPEAIKIIVETKTDSIEFFASRPPFDKRYFKEWAEPFAFKVVDYKQFFRDIDMTKYYETMGYFYRQPVSWELWQVIKDTTLGRIDYDNYIVINDYTCDIDSPDDIFKFEGGSL